MKVLYRLAVVMAGLAILANSAEAQRGGRRLNPGTYISSAKIEIIGYAQTHEPERIELAIAMLDSLFLHYGAHSEAYYWYSQIQWDLAKEKADLKERLPFVQKAITYADSLKWSCGQKKINKKYLKGCEGFSDEMDSIRVAQWRDYYNGAVLQITEVEEQMEAVRVETDSAALAFYQTRLDALLDSCQDNMNLALAIDASDPRPFIGLASANEKMGNYKVAISYLEKALPMADNRTQLLVEVAYDYIRDGDYCGAYPWFQEYVDSMTVDETIMADPDNREAIIGTAHNLASCYNNCKVYDSAYLTFQKILSFDPNDVKALQGSARYEQHRGREASDSAQTYRETDPAKSATWQDVRNQRFDSAIVYLARAFELDPDDAALAAEYGLMAAIRERFAEAKVPFERACELEPTSDDYWTSLGDCNISLKDWAGAAAAYEHVVEIKPDNKRIWEQLELLYSQGHKNPQRLAEVKAKLKTL